MPVHRFNLQDTALLVVDLQEKLLPHMHNAADLTRQAGRLIDGANALSLPVLVTEHYRKGLGVTVPEIASRIGGAVCNHDKVLFSACIDPIRGELASRKTRTVLVCGLEAHVCVLQTCLDLLEAGYVTALVTDAIGSRRAFDQEMAVQRLVQAGAVPTTVESVLFEVLRAASHPLFKSMLPIVK